MHGGRVHTAGITAASTETLLSMISALAEPEKRATSARALAQYLGGSDILFFSADPELRTMLPAPGLPQTLSAAKAWHRLIDKCGERGMCHEEIDIGDGTIASVTGVRAGDCAAMLVGADIKAIMPAALVDALPLLSRLFHTERVLKNAQVQVTTFSSSAARAAVLADTLDAMRRRLEKALAEAQDARHTAEEANRAKSAFLATMSHELRTPLNAMLGYSDLLLTGVPVSIPPEAAKMVERIEISARHLLGLIDEILTFSKLEAGEEVLEAEDVPLQSVLLEIVALTEPLALMKGVRYETDFNVGDAVVRTDPRKLRQILVNLLSNAAKFTTEGSVEFVAELTAGGMYFEVSDTGPGIAEDEKSMVFEPFWQSHAGHTRTAGGTGLGLTITLRLARLMGGDVALASEMGKGTTFCVMIPQLS